MFRLRLLIAPLLLLVMSAPASAQVQTDDSELSHVDLAAGVELQPALVEIEGLIQKVDFGRVGDDAIIDGDTSLGLYSHVQQETAGQVLNLLAAVDVSVLDAETKDLVTKLQTTMEEFNRGAIQSGKRTWPGTTIPYVIDASVVDHDLLQNIAAAIEYWNDTSPFVKLAPRNGQHDYLRIVDGPTDSWYCLAQVGYRLNYGGYLKVDPDCPQGTIVHELMHAAGMMHEHQRSDRDTYLNMASFAQEGDNVGKRPLSWSTEFDPCSMMIYSPNVVYNGHQGGLYTLKPLGAQKLTACKAQLEPACRAGAPGQRCQMSVLDLEALKHLYEGH